MHIKYTIGLLFLLQVAGCATTGTAPAKGAVQGGSIIVERLLPDAAQGQPDAIALSQGAAGAGGTVVVERLPPLPENAPKAPPVAVAPAASIAPITIEGGSVIVERLLPDAAQGRTDTMAMSQGAGGTVVVERLPLLPENVPEAPPVAVAPAASIAPIPAVAPVIAEPAMQIPVTPVTVTSPVPSPSTTTPPVAATPSVTVTPSAGTAAPDKPTVKVPPKATAPVARTPPPQKSQTAAPARAKVPSLDLAALEQRLKSTDAIGVFTKIALKNQVDDLLNRFKSHHEGNGKPPLAQLRQSYEQLLLKVNDVLKNGDPSLAGEIMGSRETIWGVLTDPVKFAKL